MSPTISVALCTHNGAAHLEEQLRSILAQSLPAAEIVVSDDASSDNSLAILHSVFESSNPDSGQLPRLVVLQNAQPLGVTANFEQALRKCSGDLIALCDQDDVWHPDRLRVAVESFAGSERLDLLCSDARLVDEFGTPLGYSLFEALEISDSERLALGLGGGFRALLRRNLVTGATSMVRRELVRRAVPFPHPWVHDEWLAAIGAATGTIEAIAEQLIDYRQHGGNQIGVKKRTLAGKFHRIVEPRNGRNQYLLERALTLSAALAALGDAVPLEYRELARQKVDHERVRAALPASRPRRWPAVLKEASTGRYSRFGRGFGDVLRDLLQPAGIQP